MAEYDAPEEFRTEMHEATVELETILTQLLCSQQKPASRWTGKKRKKRAKLLLVITILLLCKKTQARFSAMTSRPMAPIARS